MSQQRGVNPHARSLRYLNPQDTFKTTYGTSYQDMPTAKVSPVYDDYRERDYENYSYYPRDLSPYPMTRDPESKFRDPRPFRTDPQEVYGDRYDGDMSYRSRFEDSTLRRDEYREPIPNRPREQMDEPSYPSMERSQGLHMERGRPGKVSSKAEKLLAQYDDLVAEGQNIDPSELKLEVCNQCFKSNVCMNNLGCGHHYCDECMARMPGADGPFRDSVRWYYNCPFDNKRTSEAKLVRTDPYGRRLVRFHDVGYFKTT
ncbi:uncharacterized protein LOC128230276 isoform X1 [Mya arenaria]|uniref:uncharacterized protein LOC128230276 isoform X1 n=1 Tax=Mya arenaria TaxID=6604 RepID=UPI0022E42897|nr:uncharacterized protein LOC128230276 isoform X1 [Mya arenaria]